MPNAVEIVKLRKVFRPPWQVSSLWRSSSTRGAATVALTDVTLQIRPGEIFGLVGANRAGKTTLLKVLATLVLPTSGQVLVNGCDVTKEDFAVKCQLGLVTGDERSFYWRLTGRQNLAFFATLYGLSDQQFRLRLRELDAWLELDGLDRRVQAYSTGMRQRLAVARALLHDPPILLLDEPTKSLDPPTAQRFRVFLRKRAGPRESRTVILATHNLAEAEQVCERIAVLYQGRCVAAGTAAELKASFPSASLEDVLGRLMR